MMQDTAHGAKNRAWTAPAALSLFFLLLSAALCLLLNRYTVAPNYALALIFLLPAALLAAAGYGIDAGSLPFYEGEEDIPADLTLYVLYFKGDGAQTLNHGQSCLAAISQAEHTILYLYEKW